MSRTVTRSLLILVGLALLLQTSALHAVSKESYPVAYDQLWSCVVRLLRVNEGFDVTDQDKDAGYIVFTYKSQTGQTSRATVEIFPEGALPRSEAKRLIVQITLSGASSIEERMLLSALQKKLREEQLI